MRIPTIGLAAFLGLTAAVITAMAQVVSAVPDEAPAITAQVPPMQRGACGESRLGSLQSGAGVSGRARGQSRQ